MTDREETEASASRDRDKTKTLTVFVKRIPRLDIGMSQDEDHVPGLYIVQQYMCTGHVCMVGNRTSVLVLT